MQSRKLFCELGPVAYYLAVKKENLRRTLKDAFAADEFSKQRCSQPFPTVVKSHRSLALRRLLGVDMRLQQNKLKNLNIACKKISGIVVDPGQTFSFWKALGSTPKRKGYLEGLVIKKNTLGASVGGGICQLANMIHWLVLNSPLAVVEIHHHSDALFPDERRRVPFGTGTSVFYKNVDYRFKNVTDVPVQLLLWVEGEELFGELRATKNFPLRYRIVEEDHHFRREGNKYYRISRIYRFSFDRATSDLVGKELVLANHSEVMYNHALIPPHEIRDYADVS